MTAEAAQPAQDRRRTPRLRPCANLSSTNSAKSSSDSAQNHPTLSTGIGSQPGSQRSPLFPYPALPRGEIALCWAVVIGALAYAWTCVYRVSQRWAQRVGDASAMRYLPLVGWRFKDEIDWEWSRWSPMAWSYLPWLIGHAAIFNSAHRWLPTRRHAQLLCTAYSLLASARTFGLPLVAFSVTQGCFLFACTFYSRRSSTVWISALPSLYVIMNHSSLLSTDIFHVLLFASYTTLSYISFCLDWARGEIHAEPDLSGKNVQSHANKLDPLSKDLDGLSIGNDKDSLNTTDKFGTECNVKNPLRRPDVTKNPLGLETDPGSLLRRMFFYAFYQPYLFSLIVPFGDFERQYADRERCGADSRSARWTAAAWRAVRVAFWWAVLELALHFLYFGSILHDERFFERLPKDEFVTMGMAIGAFFHLKYVVIFGLPAAFALADGMRPPAGAICISRVALYSKIWRGFDRGLYAFFKTYIFLPICAPSFSAGRRVAGVLVSYLFVLVWHGFHHQNLVWIGLNIVELFIEYGAKAVYSIPAVREWRERHISSVAFRRCLGVAQILPFAFGLYSNFYFLGGSRVGWLFVRRIFLEETVTLRWPFFLLILIGYFYMQVTIEVERLMSAGSNEHPVKEGPAGCPFGAQAGAKARNQNQNRSPSAKKSK